MSTSTTAGGPSTAPVRSDATHRQAAALEESGWGADFVLFQPHNLCFWLYVSFMTLGAVHMWSFYAPSAGFYAEPLAVGAALCALCAAAWWWWFRWIDRWERQPVSLVVAGFAWGAIAAVFAFGLTANNALIPVWGKLFGQEWAASWAAGATAPFTEEAAKLCGFVLLMGLAPRLVRTPNDGLVLGAFIGLGLGVFEDFMYVSNAVSTSFSTDSMATGTQMALTRIGFSAASHPLYAALVCCGFVYLVGTAAQPRRTVRGVALVVTGLFIHWTWDSFPAIGEGSDARLSVVMLASIVLGFVVLYLAFRSALPREHRWVRGILAPEVEAGTVTADEVEAVLTRRSRKVWVRAAPSRSARRARKRMRASVLDLTHDVARARGRDSAAVLQSRADLAQLRAAAQQP